MQIYFTTVVREAPMESSGEIVSLDWDSKSIDARRPLFADTPELEDPNPRGNSRGGRGIALLDDGNVAAASYHTIHLYDGGLRPITRFSHGLMVGLHEVHLAPDSRLWLSSTAIDAAVQLDLETGRVEQTFWPREAPTLQEQLGLAPLAIDKHADNRGRFLGRHHLESPSHLHLNAVASYGDNVFALFHAQSVIANLDTCTTVVRHDALKGAHNLVIDDGLATVSDTWGRKIRTYDLATGRLVRTIDLMAYRQVRRLARRHDWRSRWSKGLHRVRGQSHEARPQAIFVRGLDRVGHLLFAGVSPATILCIDEVSGELIDLYQHSDNIKECIHGLRVAP